jgi:hypothetical protein
MAPDASFGAAGVLFFVIKPGGSYVTDQDPDAERPVRNARPGEVTVSTTPASTSLRSPNDDPCFTIAVHVDRIERVVDHDGFGEEFRIPLAGIGMEFRESDLVFDDSYGTLGTDANGNVVGSFCDDDGIFDDELEIYIRITAERGDPRVYVEDSSWIDEIYEYDTNEVSSSGGWIDFNINLGYDWSGIFNIVDAAWQARQFWLDSGGTYDEEVEIHWEPGYGDEKSSYDGYYNEITIADGPSDSDEWEESAIMHEWGHSADDFYSCDDAPGGDHSWGQNIDSEMAWGEGFPDYYQSAVRDYYGYIDASHYVSIDGAGVSHSQSMEDCWFCDKNTENEGAIATALWDLYDTEGSYDDWAEHGHASIQAVYVSSEFNDVAYGLFDDTCDFDTYMRGWVDYGLPADWKTADAVKQNTGYNLEPSAQLAAIQGDRSTESNFTPAEVYRWWKQLTYVGDNSSSMSGAKFNAMKVLFEEAVNDLGDDPEGTEFTLELFNNTITNNDIAFAGQFYPGDLIDPINNLTTIPDADPHCGVYALRALSQAVDNQEKGDVWLFTDGDTAQLPSVQTIRQLLTENKMRASMALMGLCQPKGENVPVLEPISTELLQGLTPDEQQILMAERLLPGAARADLGLMADDIPGGIVPYLLTALNSGGQFLYVDSSQVDDAADILRAQITNSAGAGRWSDYVSDQPTYLHDTLASWEYNWINAKLGTKRGNPGELSKLDIPIPGYFQYFSGPYYDTVHVFEDGYLTLGLHEAYVYNNTMLPNPAEPNSALYPFWDNIKPYCPPGAESTSEACVGFIYTIQDGDWFVIEYDQYQYNYNDPFVLNTFEILLNLETYEIRYQYLSVPHGAESATIGLENSNGTNGFHVSYDDVNGAVDGTGYKFVPAPPQPTKTYIVTVDSTMESVGFLLTGYSGSFEPLEITDPDGVLITCTDPGTMCLDLDLVQYVQVNTNGRTGDWQALVDAGNTGSGTFSFTSFAVSPIAVDSSNNHILSTGTQQILVGLSGQVDGCTLSGQFHKANGSPFGNSFGLYDDGLHNDNQACDGQYGSGSFYLGAGSVYLTLQGLHNGEPFTRIDPVPYTFQPLLVKSLNEGANFGGVTQLDFQFTNYDSYDHCYWLTYSLPEGWWIDFPNPPPHGGCLYAGQTAVVTYDVYMDEGFTNDLPSGTTGIVTMAATEWEKGAISDSDSTRITRHREPYRIDIFNPIKYLAPNGAQATIDFLVTDIQGVVVADGTELQLIANNGDISPVFGSTKNGSVVATYTSGANLGSDIIMAQTLNGVTASTNIEIANPIPSQITLSLSTNLLPADGTSSAQLVATVRDDRGNPVANQLVQIGVESDDGQLGTISGGEVVSGMTNSAGQFSATFINSGVVGSVGVRAEFMIYENGDPVVSLHDRRIIYIGTNPIFLPVIRR